ncbi:hypothetical protein OKW46_004709 [Paraburkholderia sp. WSM4179]|nr:hypothetical protein [Paraburkholderia sp. WSM4179]
MAHEQRSLVHEDEGQRGKPARAKAQHRRAGRAQQRILSRRVARRQPVLPPVTAPRVGVPDSGSRAKPAPPLAARRNHLPRTGSSGRIDG